MNVRPFEKAVVIADGLTKSVLSPDHPYRASHDNVGDRESERLFGRGRGFGEGPLPVFLQAVAEGDPELVLLSPAAHNTNAGEDTGGFLEPIDELAGRAAVVPADEGVIPADGLIAALDDLGVSATRRDEVRLLVVGCHTDRRILGLASLLRNVWGFSSVAVSPHLVGSSTQEAHFATLRHTFPAAGIGVLLDLEEAAEFVGLSRRQFSRFERRPVTIEPPEALEALGDTGRDIIELLCMNWTRTRLRPLAGGFSGSLLFLADGWKGGARTEPLVVKIDAFAQMRRELNGYHQVKDFFGKHVPTFGYPITRDESIGVGMELAAMEGRPQTCLLYTSDAADDASSV